MLLENAPYEWDGRVPQEAIALTEAGYHISVICQPHGQHHWHRTLDGVQIYEYPPPPSGRGILGFVLEYGYSMLAAFVLTLVVWRREGFDVIHAHNPPDTFVLIALFFKLFGKRFIFDHHDLAPEMYVALSGGRGNRFVYRMLVWFEKLSCRAADHIIATNQSYKRMEIERDHVPAERITIVRNGPDLNRLRPVAPDPGLRQKAATLIGYVGVLGRQDGVDYLIRAVAHLVYDLKRTDAFCVIIGRGSAMADLRNLTSRLGLDQHIWFTGFVPDADLIRYLSTVDICVDSDPANPFTDRSTMMKMTEYMAMGKPIVAFDLTEHRETARDAALYVPPNNEFEFARALAALIDDPARRHAMGAYGRRRIETELEWRYSIPHLIGVYDKLLFGIALRHPTVEGDHR
jgi:glycosyltransferase involved in cell wall biosynthesis